MLAIVPWAKGKPAKAAVVLLAVVALASPHAAMAEEHPLGCLPESFLTFEPLTSGVASQAITLEALPSAVDHTAAMPPVKSQGAQSSCTAWSVAYAMKSYAEGQEHGWDLLDPFHQASAAFAYNQTNGGRDAGAYVSHVYWLLGRRGAASLADMPYSASDYISWPSEAASKAALDWRSLNWTVLAPSDVASVKQELADGYVLQLTIEVDHAWDSLGAGTNYVWYPDRQTIRGGHSVCIVGYDDNRAGGAFIGAFKIQNSWGTGWGDGGYAWVAYDAMASAGVQSVTKMDDRTNYVSTAKVWLTLDHPFRGQLRISVGAGPVSKPVYLETFYDPTYTNQGSVYDGRPGVTAVLDVTGGAPYVGSHSWWVKIRDCVADGLVGAVTLLRLESGGTVLEGEGLPAALADGGNSYVYFSAGAGATPTATFTPAPPTPTPTSTLPEPTHTPEPSSTPTPTATATPAAASCQSCDYNLDGAVSWLDISILSMAYGSSVGDPRYRPQCDLNGDGKVNHVDLSGFSVCYGTSW